jgi:hypothetical protein
VRRVLPSARRPSSSSQIGKRRDGLVHRNCFSRFRIRWLSSQARSLGPSVEGRGDGSRIVRWSVPALVGSGGVVPGIVGDDGRDAEARVRWHSLRIPGREDAGRVAGREKAWIEFNKLDAKGRVDVGPGTVMG